MGPVNRKLYVFNSYLDNYVLLPAVRVYRNALPDPVRQAITNFFANLNEVTTFVNLLLQTLGLNRMQRPRWLRRYQMLDWARDDERDVEVISGCYLLVRRTTLAQVGLLDESFFLYGEETDWCRRCAEAGWRLVFAPVGSIVHHGSGSSRKLNYKRDLMLTEGTVRLHRKHGGAPAALSIWL